MKESRKTGLLGTFWICFVIGLLLFLTDTRSTGGALERFNMIVFWSTTAIVGFILGLLSLVALMVLYFPELRKFLKHK